MRPARSVAVIGAGISGLATAYSLRHRADVTVFEAAGRPGGQLWTVETGGATVEAGADSFVVRKPWAIELCDELGLSDRVVIPGAFGAFVKTRDGLVRLPERTAFGIPAAVSELVRWPGLRPRHRARALADFVIPAGRGGRDRALGALVRRRLGREASRVLVEPLLGGLHAGDPMRLSVEATFPELAEWERRHGSLIKGASSALEAADRPGTGRKPLFATLWGGLSGLVDRLVEACGPEALMLDASVESVRRDGTGFAVAAPGATLRADAVVVTTPAFEAARLLRGLHRTLPAELEAIPYASTAVVILVYPPGTGGRLPADGTGFVVPNGGVVTACTWVSRKWPTEEFGDRAVIRCFVGRAGAEAALQLGDDELVDGVRREVEPLTPPGAAPEATRVIRWDRSMPQCEVGHLDRLERIDAALGATPGIFLAGSAYRGVGIADCIRQGREAARRVAGYLDGIDGHDVIAGATEEATTWTT